jgi:phage tail sheath protein FI
MAVLHFFSNGGRDALVVSTERAGKRDDARVEGADLAGSAGKETGIHALSKSTAAGVSPRLLVIPDTVALSSREHAAVVKAALAYCADRGMFYLMDPPMPRAGRRVLERTIDWAGKSDWARHPNAAVYFPRIETPDPAGKGAPLLVPPGGAMAGIYARIDARRGVWKAPAGTEAQLLAARGPEIALTDAQAQKLQGAGINPIRQFPGRGLLAWGARTFADTRADAEWKYVNVRRLMLFIEESLNRGIGWVVFEPNGEPLWAQIRLSVSSFLNQLWRSGAFVGGSSREAYFVRCDRETTTQADIEKGVVNVLVGFAPLKPAEFVIFRIGQKTADVG